MSVQLSRKHIDAVIRRAKTCRLAVCDGEKPYVVPLSFGYDGEALYLHGGRGGRWRRTLRTNCRVCFEFDVDVEPAPAERPCRWSMRYRSVIGFGHAQFIKHREAKRRALATIMAQYSKADWQFPDEAVDRTTVVRVEIEEVTGRQAGY